MLDLHCVAKMCISRLGLYTSKKEGFHGAKLCFLPSLILMPFLIALTSADPSHAIEMVWSDFQFFKVCCQELRCGS